MALIDKASLLMVPSTYEDGTLYNVLPSGNKAPDETGSHNGYDQTRADFTFSRGSNLAATRVNADGLIEKGRENLLTYSNDFSDSDWNKTNCTITSNYIANPIDGSVNAPNITIDQTGGSYEKTMTQTNLTFVSGNVYCVSVYMKAGSVSSDTLRILAYDGSQVHSSGFIRLDDVEASGCKYETASDGWNRFYFYFKATNSGLGYIYIFNYAYGQVTNANTNLYLFGAQWELGTYPTPYIESGATTAKAGILEDMPRIDYSSGTGALLLEPGRTNLLPHSEYFGASDWAKLNTSVTINEIASPEGIVNASKITTTSGGGASNVNDVIYKSANTDYTFSVFVKAGNTNRVMIGQQMTGLYSNNIYDLSTNTWVLVDSNSPTLDAQDFGNGWYRLSMTENSGASASNYQSWVGPIDNDGTAFNSTTTGNYIYTFGAQLEAASHASSYIPSYGSAVTRSADSCSVTGVSDVIGQTEGTLYFEVDLSDIETAGGYSGIQISDGTSNNQIYIVYYSDGRVQTVSTVSGSIVVNLSFADYGLSAGRHKFAVAYKANDYAFYIDGASVGTDTSATVPATSKVDLFFNSLGSLNHKEVTLFDTRLTNSELATLTTL